MMEDFALITDFDGLCLVVSAHNVPIGCKVEYYFDVEELSHQLMLANLANSVHCALEEK